MITQAFGFVKCRCLTIDILHLPLQSARDLSSLLKAEVLLRGLNKLMVESHSAIEIASC